MKAIEAEHVNKQFTVGTDQIHVLHDINLSISKNEFLSIMGPSGCGKSTLLYLLGGLDKPTSGTVTVNGRDLATLSEKETSVMKRREIGFIFQFYNLVPNLSVEDNIMLPLILDKKKLSLYENKLTEILDVIEMSHKRKASPRELSGGQQQRVAVARALIFEPDILLADEPTGNLDSKSGKDVMTLFQTIHRDLGKTIVQVTHSSEAASYGSSIIQMKDGMILQKESIQKAKL